MSTARGSEIEAVVLSSLQMEDSRRDFWFKKTWIDSTQDLNSIWGSRLHKFLCLWLYHFGFQWVGS